MPPTSKKLLNTHTLTHGQTIYVDKEMYMVMIEKDCITLIPLKKDLTQKITITEKLKR